MRPARERRGGGQTWATFVKNHANDIWCCAFMQTYDPLFRPLFLFFLVNQGSRKVVRVAATRSPTQEWTAQRLRNAIVEGLAPRVLIRDRDEKFGATFDGVAEGAGARVIKRAVRAPNMNPVAERFIGSLRREAPAHVLLLDDQHLEKRRLAICQLFQQSPTSPLRRSFRLRRFGAWRFPNTPEDRVAAVTLRRRPFG